MVFERNGEFLGVTVEAVDDVSKLKANVSIKLIQVGEEVLVEQHFQEDFTQGATTIGSTKFLSWEELTKPSRKIVINDLVFVRVRMELYQY